MGKFLILQPDAKLSSNYDLLPSGSWLVVGQLEWSSQPTFVILCLEDLVKLLKSYVRGFCVLRIW
ncbi:hypothetical protein Hanom_Chr12g01068241 [Helianthus anomalus]